MVNYCCVKTCGRNSKSSNHLIFYSLPKERHRQEEWLKAGGRDDLLAKLHLKATHRFCSRHFAPSSIKSRNLCPNAVPTLCLPESDEGTIPDEEHPAEPPPVVHDDVVCNNCRNAILGFRYKCVNCADYDLCPKCEMQETHAHHYMLRIPKPLKFKIADDLIKKWQEFFKAEHVKPSTDDSDDSNYSSDDEPITKYVKQYDSGIDLSDDVKDTIRNEITRVLNLKNKNRPSGRDSKKRVGATKRSGDDLDKTAKKQKADDFHLNIDNVQSLRRPSEATSHVQSTPEVAFADVNQLGDQNDMKFEVPILQQNFNESEFVQPLMHVKLSDDLSELMIEMTQNGDKTIYKYAD